MSESFEDTIGRLLTEYLARGGDPPDLTSIGFDNLEASSLMAAEPTIREGSVLLDVDEFERLTRIEREFLRLRSAVRLYFRFEAGTEPAERWKQRAYLTGVLRTLAGC